MGKYPFAQSSRAQIHRTANQSRKIRPGNPGCIFFLLKFILGNTLTFANAKQLAYQESVDDLFTSVSNGKSLVASAITDKGVSTASDATFQTMAENIRSLLTVASNPKTLFNAAVKTRETPYPNTTISSWNGYYYLAGSITIPENFTIALLSISDHSSTGVFLDDILDDIQPPTFDNSFYANIVPSHNILIINFNGYQIKYYGTYMNMSDQNIYWTINIVKSINNTISWSALSTNTFQQLSWGGSSYNIAASATSVGVAYI